MNINKTSLYEKVKIVFIAFCIMFVAYSTFFNYFFTSDHVGAYAFNPEVAKPARLLGYCVGGRVTYFFYCWISYLLSFLGITVFYHRNVYLVILLISLAFSYGMLYEIYEPFVEKRNKKWLIFILAISFVNPYVVELFVYLGWELGLGVLFTISAVLMFTQKKYILSSFLLFLGIGSYQSLFSVFMICTLLWLYVNYPNWSKNEFWKNTVFAFAITGLVCFFTILFTNLAAAKFSEPIYENKTVTVETISQITLFYRIKKLFWKYYYTTVSGIGLLPKYFLFGAIIVSFLLAFICIIRSRKFVKMRVFLLVILMALINVLPVSIYFLTPKYDVFARIVWPIFLSVFALLYIPLTSSEVKKGIEGLYKGVTIIILAVIVYSTYTSETNFFISNSLDEQIIRQVEASIEHYEEETGITVTTIAARRHEGAKDSHIQTDSGTYNYTHKSMYDAWSDVELLNMLLQTSYHEISMDEETYELLFGDKIWDTFVAEEQLVFDGDVLYWAVY